MNRFLMFFLVFFLGNCGILFPQKKTSPLAPYIAPKYTASQLLKDVEILQNIIELAHPSIDWHTPRQAWEAGIDSLKKQINVEMTEREFLAKISLLLANIRCGHTTFDPSENYQKQGKRLPLDLVFLEDKAHIIKSHYPNTNLPMGAEILAINGEPFSKILQKILPRLSQDAFHYQYKWQLLQEDFANYYDLFVAQPDSFKLDLRARNGDFVSYKIPAVDSSFLREFDKDYINRIIQNPALSLTFLHLDSAKKIPQYISLIPKEKQKEFAKNTIAVLRINSFLPEEMRVFKQRFERDIQKIFKMLSQNPPKALVIDIRDNDGGALWYVKYLFDFIYQKPYNFVDKIIVTGNGRFPEVQKNPFIKKKLHKANQIELNAEQMYVIKDKYVSEFSNQKLSKNQKKYYYEGKLFVLTSNKTFSAGSHFANLIKQTKRGILVGEETGGGAKGCTAGYFLGIKLPNTQAQIQIPVERWQQNNVNVPQENGVLPDYRIPRNIDFILQGKDNVMDFVVWKMEN